MAPWTAEEFRRKHNKRLTDAQAKHAATVADAVLKRTGDEAQAVRIGNSVAHAHIKRGMKKKS